MKTGVKSLVLIFLTKPFLWGSGTPVDVSIFRDVCSQKPSLTATQVSKDSQKFKLLSQFQVHGVKFSDAISISNCYHDWTLEKEYFIILFFLAGCQYAPEIYSVSKTKSVQRLLFHNHFHLIGELMHHTSKDIFLLIFPLKFICYSFTILKTILIERQSLHI